MAASRKPRAPRASARAAGPEPAAAVGARPRFDELGVTGLTQSLGVVGEEILRELQGTRGIRVYKEMQTDPIVSAALDATMLTLRKPTWSAEPASPEPDDVAAADFVASCIDDMSASWSDTIEEALSMLAYGWSAHEIVYKLRAGKAERPGESSAYDDGLVGWRKLPIRSQDTLERWEFGSDGGVQALVQRDPNTYALHTIPIERLLLFRPRVHKGSPEGRSLLRPAYVPWYFKTNLQRFEAIGAERDLAGMPFSRIPAEVLNADGPVAAQYKKIVTQIRANRQQGLVFPSDPWPNAPTLRQYDLELLRAAGPKQVNTDALIQRYDWAILMTMRAQFLKLGQQEVGSYALTESHYDLFSVAATALLDSVASVLNRHAIPRLLALNPSLAVGEAGFPSLRPGPIARVDIEKLANAWATLATSGFAFTDADEAWLRQKAGLPVDNEAST